MTYAEFKKKYNGKYVDVDDYPKEWKYQCFDLAQLYITECLGLPSSILAGCHNVCNMLKEPKLSLMKKYFDEVPSTAMKPGDIVVWYNNHIAIFDSWNEKEQACYYFSQNPNASKVMKISMGEFKAFRKKGTSSTTTKTEYINIPPTIEERNIYKKDTKKQFATIKPKKFGGLSYKIYSYVDNKEFAEIQTQDYGRCLVKVKSDPTITTAPKYKHGNY